VTRTARNPAAHGDESGGALRNDAIEPVYASAGPRGGSDRRHASERLSDLVRAGKVRAAIGLSEVSGQATLVRARTLFTIAALLAVEVSDVDAPTNSEIRRLQD